MYRKSFSAKRLGDSNEYAVAYQCFYDSQLQGMPYSLLAEEFPIAGFLTEHGQRHFTVSVHRCRITRTPGRHVTEGWDDDVPGVFASLEAAIAAVGEHFDPKSHELCFPGVPE